MKGLSKIEHFSKESDLCFLVMEDVTNLEMHGGDCEKCGSFGFHHVVALEEERECFNPNLKVTKGAETTGEKCSSRFFEGNKTEGRIIWFPPEKM